RFTGGDNDGYFDGLSLRSLRTPVLVVGDVELSEGDSGTTPALFEVALSCVTSQEVSAVYATVDGSATAGEDYQEPAGGELTLAAGETSATIEVPILGDVLEEPDENFFLQLAEATHAVVWDGRGEALIRDDDAAPGALCPDPATIGYRGYTAADCAVPQNAVTVFTQEELDAYMSDFGLDGAKVRNIKVNFNPSGEVVIVSPCEIKLNGDGGYLDVTAEKLCLYGRKGVTAAEDHGNPDQGIVAGTIMLVSEEGSAGFSKGLELTAGEISVQALKQAEIGLAATVQVTGSVTLVSTGDLASSDALIRRGSYVSAAEVLL
ncbi:MAG: hypothetical protein GY856_23300, partial [bacterium]|nr:hypothetical protein [bacterium]